MATTAYATVAELKTRIGIAASDLVDDAVLGAVLGAVSEGIDNYCNRAFGQIVEARTFSPRRADQVLIDDCVSLTAVATDDGSRTYPTAWALTDCDLLPENAGAREPFTVIAVSPRGRYVFPLIRKGLRLTGAWGWPAVPGPVREACLIQSARVFKRKDAPFGITGTPEYGQMRLGRFDPDVAWLLEPYRKIVVG